ncbi:MAG: LacI family DNA-binding transcriptional regulator [Tissierellia bacterium]|nr:LacI family DNA-binding transcriptional regulator [Tissierellia bacterium]
MAVTIKDVAREAGVSITTVSMVLNESDYPISEKTKERVFQVAKELNYVPNRIARSLARKKSDTIALVVPDISNPFYPEMAKAVSEITEQRKYHLLLINTDNDRNKKQSWIDILEKGYVEGALVVSRDPVLISRIQDSPLRIKTVYLDEPGFEEVSGGTLVTGDSEHGGYLAAEHFIKTGLTKLACITGPEKTPNSGRRLSGFIKCCMEYGVYLESENILFGDYSYRGGYEAGQVLAQRDIEGIFCFNDLSAYGAIKAIKEMKLEIPEDISVIGYDNLSMTQYIDPLLTTVDQFSAEIGRRGTQILFDLIDGVEGASKTVLIEPKLIQRQTTKEKGERRIESE